MDSVLKQLYFVFAMWPIFGAAFLTVGHFIYTKIKK